MLEHNDCDRKKYESTWRNREEGQSLSGARVPLRAHLLNTWSYERSVPEIKPNGYPLIHHLFHQKQGNLPRQVHSRWMICAQLSSCFEDRGDKLIYVVQSTSVLKNSHESVKKSLPTQEKQPTAACQKIELSFTSSFMRNVCGHPDG